MLGLDTQDGTLLTATVAIASPPPQQITVQPVIMAGGVGTRLWPLSREQYPKQFLALSGKETLLQQAVIRGLGLGGPSRRICPPIVVGNEAHRFMLQEQLREIGVKDARILLEPVGRNTAPALTLAAFAALDTGDDPVLVVTPSDQTIAAPSAYEATVARAVEIAAQGGIVMLGIPADRPETGYGYIATEPHFIAGVMRVTRFEEKPDLHSAMRYVADGDYHWNSGIFVLRASTWIAALDAYEPAMAHACHQAWRTNAQDGNFTRAGEERFAAVPSKSIDYAVIERCVGGAWPLHMLRLDAGWSDLGAWESVWQVAPKDEHGNVTHGDTLLHESRNTLVHATSRLVSVIGLDDVVVVETPDAVMVASRARSQHVKQVVDVLARNGRSEQVSHLKVRRPWGWYDSVAAGHRFHVKRIMVHPGASLSLQMHHHRAEHWIVVSGTAEVTNGETKALLSENQSIYIPLGQRHRLANPGKVPLEIVEVQSGTYLGEDDIVRFEDVYGRG